MYLLGMSVFQISVFLTCVAFAVGGVRGASRGYSNPNDADDSAGYTLYKGKAHLHPTSNYAQVSGLTQVQSPVKLAKGILLSIRVVNPEDSSGQPGYAAQVPIHFADGRVETGPITYGGSGGPCPEDQQEQHGHSHLQVQGGTNVAQPVEVPGYGVASGTSYATYQSAVEGKGFGGQAGAPVAVHLAAPSRGKAFQYHQQSYSTVRAPGGGVQAGGSGYAAYGGGAEQAQQGYQVLEVPAHAAPHGAAGVSYAAEGASQQHYGGAAQQSYGGGQQVVYVEGAPQGYRAAAQQSYGGAAQEGYGGAAQEGYAGAAQGGYGGAAQRSYGGPAQQTYVEGPQQTYDDAGQQGYTAGKSYSGLQGEQGYHVVTQLQGNANGGQQQHAYALSAPRGGKSYGPFGAQTGYNGDAAAKSYGSSEYDGQQLTFEVSEAPAGDKSSYGGPAVSQGYGTGSAAFGKPYQISSYPAGSSSYEISPTSPFGKSYGSYGGRGSDRGFDISSSTGPGFRKPYSAYGSTFKTQDLSSFKGPESYRSQRGAYGSSNPYYSGSPFPADRLALIKYNADEALLNGGSGRYGSSQAYKDSPGYSS